MIKDGLQKAMIVLTINIVAIKIRLSEGCEMKIFVDKRRIKLMLLDFFTNSKINWKMNCLRTHEEIFFVHAK